MSSYPPSMFIFILFVPLTMLLLTIAALVIAIVVLSQTRRPRGKGVCGVCGHQVRGVTSFECPECGQDLREVGIGRAQSKAALVVLLVLLGILLLLQLLRIPGMFMFFLR